MPQRVRASKVFGQRLRDARKHRGLTQTELAALMKERGFEKVSKTTIIRIERGEGARGLELDLALGLTAALGAAFGTLLTPPEGVEVELTSEHTTDADRMREWLRRGTLTRTPGEEGFRAGVPSDARREWFEREMGRRAEPLLDAIRAKDREGQKDIVEALAACVRAYDEDIRRVREGSEEEK